MQWNLLAHGTRYIMNIVNIKTKTTLATKAVESLNHIDKVRYSNFELIKVGKKRSNTETTLETSV